MPIGVQASASPCQSRRRQSYIVFVELHAPERKHANRDASRMEWEASRLVGLRYRERVGGGAETSKLFKVLSILCRMQNQDEGQCPRSSLNASWNRITKTRQNEKEIGGEIFK